MTPSNARVLLVEDDAAVRSALIGSLDAAGFDAVGVEDAATALEVLAQRRMDVVVADYHLPGVVGLDLLAALRATAPDMTLILYSGGMTDELATEARDFRIAAVMEKPVSAEQLIAAIYAARKASGGRPSS